MTNDRPQDPFTHFAKISNGHNSAMHQPIPFMFGSRVGFWGTADRTAPFPVGSNPIQDGSWRPSWKTEILISLISQGGSIADLRHKEKEREGRS